jgi:hypothetical protein
MIKGCNKRVIVMKDTGNDMIEEAFFILKPDVSQSKNKQSGTADILKQASLILDAKGCEQPFSDIRLNVNKPYKKRSRLVPFLCGTLSGMAMTYLISLAI